MKLDLKIESITLDELQKVMEIFPPSEPAEFGYNKIIPEIEPPLHVGSLILKELKNHYEQTILYVEINKKTKFPVRTEITRGEVTVIYKRDE